VKIRESLENDKEFIRKVHQNAFGQPEGETVSQLAIDLLEDKTALPILSLVAE
jgi:putative acetyltransferase